MIASKIQLCVTIILLTRMHRSNSPADERARDIYATTMRHLCRTHNITVAQIEQAMKVVLQMDNHKPTVKMQKVAA